MAGITGTTAVCANAQNITYQVSASSAGHTYSWSVVGGTIVGASNGTSIAVNWDGNAGQGTVTVTQASTNCGSSSASINVQKSQVLATTISGTTASCSGSGAVVYSVQAVAGTTYQWTVTGGTIQAGQGTNIIDVVWSSTGTAQVGVVQTSPQCGSSSSQIQVNVSSVPAPMITGTTSPCGSSSASYSVTNVSGNTYSWTVVGGTIVGASTGNSISVTWNASGSGSVQVTQSSSVCGNGSSSLTISVQSAVQPTITGTTSTVAGSTSTTYSVPNTTGYTFSWSVVGGTIVGASNANQVVVSWGTAGAGQVNLTQTLTACGSSASTSLSVTIAGLGATTLTSPLDNAVNVSENGAFAWNSVSNASEYEIQIATNSAFTPTVVSQTVNTNSYTASSLAKGAVHYWRVRAKNGTEFGAYSSSRVFVTEFNAIPAATMLLNVRVLYQGLWDGTTHKSAPVSVELRTGASIDVSVLVTRATTSISSNGTVSVGFNNAATGNYWIVVRKGGSLSVASASAIALTDNATNSYDFTDSAAKYAGGAASGGAVLSGGVFVIYFGDADNTNFINATDINTYTVPSNGNGNLDIPAP
jgi:hypothetical protein